MKIEYTEYHIEVCTKDGFALQIWHKVPGSTTQDEDAARRRMQQLMRKSPDNKYRVVRIMTTREEVS